MKWYCTHRKGSESKRNNSDYENYRWSGYRECFRQSIEAFGEIKFTGISDNQSPIWFTHYEKIQYSKSSDFHLHIYLLPWLLQWSSEPRIGSAADWNLPLRYPDEWKLLLQQSCINYKSYAWGNRNHSGHSDCISWNGLGVWTETNQPGRTLRRNRGQEKERTVGVFTKTPTS